METYRFENINYTYNGYRTKALDNVSFSVARGDFVVVCGASGSGKSTLLKVIKERYPDFGFVMQNPSTQIVTDKVYHELAFGMENLGVPPEKMQNAIAETAVYFGMDEWLWRDTFSLSGGEKQLLNLAAAIVMNPDVLLLDEPTAQLDPMAATAFIDMVKRLNTQLGITVILVEQRLDEVLSICDKMLVLDKGKEVVYDSVQKVFAKICQTSLSDEYLCYMPSYVRLYHYFSEDKDRCPRNVKECRSWFLENAFECKPVTEKQGSKADIRTVKCKNIFFRYGRKEKDIIKDTCFEAYSGKIYGIAGGNGSGKSTFLKMLAGALRSYHGTINCRGSVAYLPQEPKYMFIEDKVSDIIKSESAILKFGISDFLSRHPYDVSGGQMQRIALAYLYEKDADIYLFDEPTKGMDPHWKRKFADWLKELAAAQKTVIIVSHDVEFAANVCEYMSMCFQSEISMPMRTEEFFRDNHFYTTAIHRIVRDRYPDIVSERFMYEK